MNIASTKHDVRRTLSLRYLGAFSLGLPLVLAGCCHAPEYSLFGSFFPVWIFCSVVGLLLGLGARAMVGRTAIADYLAAPGLLYTSMAIFFACTLWLLFYS